MKRWLLLSSIVTLALALLMILPSTAFAATTSQKAPTHVSSAATCTPTSFSVASKMSIYDQATQNYMGYVEIWRNGCGQVFGETDAYPNTVTVPTYINHFQIFNANTGATVYTAPYPGKATVGESTPVINTNGACLAALAVIQIPIYGYWGTAGTACTAG
ncbi:MAG TPA: hypothetical protein VL485_02725 [Ktedonobacteraceae bacterium]|jgi:hypothetical protein|nr:hypothetical protein [Ktedonobacteraceae bacterium]